MAKKTDFDIEIEREIAEREAAYERKLAEREAAYERKLAAREQEAERRWAEQEAEYERERLEEERLWLRKQYIDDLAHELSWGEVPPKLVEEIEKKGFKYADLLPDAKKEAAYLKRKDKIEEELIEAPEKYQAFISGEDMLGCEPLEHERMLEDIEAEFQHEYRCCISIVAGDKRSDSEKKRLKNLAIILNFSQERVQEDLQKSIEEQKQQKQQYRKQQIKEVKRRRRRKKIIIGVAVVLVLLWFVRC